MNIIIKGMFAAHIKGTVTKDKRRGLRELKGKTIKKKRIKKTNGMMIVNATLRIKKQAKVKRIKTRNTRINQIMKATKATSRIVDRINPKRVLLRKKRKRIHPKNRKIKIMLHKRK